MNSRIIQLVALVVMLLGATAGGMLLRPILRGSEEAGLRYTDVSVEGAPPWVAIGTAIGALRGLIVDILWIKVHYMKQEGLFYEVMADAELITKLQPRFAGVWAFHGHNMAYNISVATHTPEERWQWVRAGIRLVQNEGLRHNPNDLVLHKELAFWYAHKIEGVADDAHIYYKREFAREWHFLLGEPPVSHEDRVEWIRKVADAPETLEAAEQRTPGVKQVVESLNEAMSPLGKEARFKANYEFLEQYGKWKAVTQESQAAEILGVAAEWRRQYPYFQILDRIASDPQRQEEWDTLISYVRKKVLRDEYNMDPRLMYEFTRDLGPIDWRHGQAHALYWSRRGSKFGEVRVSDTDDIYKMLNNDRLQLQAMQDLARWGRINFDPFSTELPSRFPDPRWVDVIAQQFEHFYDKHMETRGGGGDSFATFLENFMSSAVREAYRSGETARAKRLYEELDELFGTGAPRGLQTTKYILPLEVFVREQIRDEYQFQPHLAPSEAAASMKYALRVGVGMDREEIYRQAVVFINEVIGYFKGNEYYDFTNPFGYGRMSELMKDFPTLQREVFKQLMVDPTVRLQERATIWSKVDKFAPRLRVEAYDQVAPIIQQQLQSHELGQKYTMDDLFPKPPGLELFRAQLEEQRRRLEQQRQQEREELRAAPKG